MFFFADDFFNQLGPLPIAGHSIQFTAIPKPFTGDRTKGKEVEGTLPSGTPPLEESTHVSETSTGDKSKGKAVEGAPPMGTSSPRRSDTHREEPTPSSFRIPAGKTRGGSPPRSPKTPWMISQFLRLGLLTMRDPSPPRGHSLGSLI